jgi:hypothetical protein
LWLEAGLGGPGIAGLLGFNFQTQKRMISLQMLARDSQAEFFVTPRQSAVSYGVLYGSAYRQKAWLLSASAGLGLVRGFHRGWQTGSSWFGTDYKLDYYTTIGIPAQIQAALQSRGLGMGLSMFTNVSLEGAFGGLLLTLQIGKLKPKRVSNH